VPNHGSTNHPLLTAQGASLLEREVPRDIADSSRNGRSTPATRVGAGAVAVKCSGCEQPITFEPPVPGEPVGLWICKTCGAVYYGDDAEEAAANAFGVVRAAGSKTNPYVGRVTAAIDARVGSIPPEYVQRLVHSLAGRIYDGTDRRTHRRYRMAVPVVAVPLGFDFKIAGEPLRMTTKDISLGGVSLIHTRFTEQPYFALDFTAAGVEHVQVIVEVLSVRNFGPVYEVAGRFVDRVPRQCAAPS
jgi:hypothetical protein